jgi:hypothetical protein
MISSLAYHDLLLMKKIRNTFAAGVRHRRQLHRAGAPIIVFMPVVNMLTDAASINSVHMAVVLIVTVAFGLITPPYGLALLIASTTCVSHRRCARRCRSTSSSLPSSPSPSSSRTECRGCRSTRSRNRSVVSNARREPATSAPDIMTLPPPRRMLEVPVRVG